MNSTVLRLVTREALPGIQAFRVPHCPAGGNAVNAVVVTDPALSIDRAVACGIGGGLEDGIAGPDVRADSPTPGRLEADGDV